VFRFTAVIRREGYDGMKISIPPAVCRGLMHLGWGGAWLDVRLMNQRCFVYPRLKQWSTTIRIPAYARIGVQVDQEVEIEIRNAESYRCRPAPPPDGCVDLTEFVPEYAFPVASDNVLTIYTRMEKPFTVKRFAPADMFRWLVTTWRHTTRSPKPRQWMLSSTDLTLIARARSALHAIGIGSGRVYERLQTTTQGRKLRNPVTALYVSNGRMLSEIAANADDQTIN
jgi:hypothetical protein